MSSFGVDYRPAEVILFQVCGARRRLLFAPPERVHQAERHSQVRLPLDRHV